MPDSNLERANDPLQSVQRKLVIAVLALIIFSAACQFVLYFLDIVRILGISILISYLFISVVDWLEKILKNRAFSIFVVYAIVAVVLVILSLTVVPSLLVQINQLIESVFHELPRTIESFGRSLAPLDERLHAAQIQVRAIDLVTTVAQSIPKPDTSMIFSRVGEVAMSTMTWLLYALSILVVSFYFMLDGYRMTDWVIAAFPKNYHHSLKNMAAEIDVSLQAFFRGQLVLGLFFGLVMLVVYLVIGVPFALVLSVLLGIWEVVPVIGPPIGFLPALIVVALNGLDNIPANRIGQVVILLLVFNIFQWLKDNLVAPRYIGNKIGLHPVVIFIAIMIGAKIDGMLGIIFAIPVASALNVVYRYMLLGSDESSTPLAESAAPVAETEAKSQTL
ncbi:AI-2E family transporter [bacterium]|nr:AI-2E family transporter [bacterium]